MSAQHMVSEASGIGQLLDERRYFEVPAHQRDYSWPIGAVEQYLEDIVDAMTRGDSDYFVGLIVLVDTDDPTKRRYQILDGQQRLATTTMIYAAIRHWLRANNFDSEAEKIQNELIGISEIGEASCEPRVVLNINNRTLFQDAVVNQCDDEALDKKLKDSSRYSSARMLIEAAIRCRRYIADLATSQGSERESKAKILFDLAKYLRDHVQINCLDVTAPENAYTIFESLNDRGIDLSVLDLLKNHMFREAGVENEAQVQNSWTKMLARLGERKADDFLKAFWTSRYGRIQRGRLFHELKKRYSLRAQVLGLSVELAELADTYADLDVSDSDLWKAYSSASQDAVRSLALLGSLQTHPVVLAAIPRFSAPQMEKLLKMLVVLIVRYQLVGRGRTGRLEIKAAALAADLFNGKISTPKAAWEELKEIVPKDDEFKQDFAKYSETKAARARYILRELELQRWLDANPGKAPQISPIKDPEMVTLEHILPKNPDVSWNSIITKDPELVSECVERLGNLCLLDKASNKKEAARAFPAKAQSTYKGSEFLLTKELAAKYTKWDRPAIEARQADLAGLAVRVWLI